MGSCHKHQPPAFQHAALAERVVSNVFGVSDLRPSRGARMFQKRSSLAFLGGDCDDGLFAITRLIITRLHFQ